MRYPMLINDVAVDVSKDIKSNFNEIKMNENNMMLEGE